MTWDGPFNGQPLRRELFMALLDRVAPDAIVETGTYLGTTTEFMADTGLPIFTIEAHPRYYGFARARLWRRRNIRLLHGDSRAVLCELFEKSQSGLSGRTVLCYLDAHWNDDLPLAEELDIIFARCPAAIVMVDDFEVPFDSGYGYDDYGTGKALNFAYIASTVSTHRLQAFYPSIPSIYEGGMCRGCVVLAKREAHGQTLGTISLLCPNKS